MAQPRPLDAGTPAQPVAPARTASRTRALLAEDNPIASELMSLMAQRVGIDLETADDGLEALERIRIARESGEPFALLFADAIMPVLGGIELAKRLRAEGITEQELPIIAVSAAVNPAEIQSYTDSGMQAYLAKPVSIADLAAAVAAWAPQSEPASETGPSGPRAALKMRYELRKAETFALLCDATDARDHASDTIARIRDLLHKLAGTAGAFGEDALSDAAGESVDILREASLENLQDALERSRALLEEAA